MKAYKVELIERRQGSRDLTYFSGDTMSRKALYTFRKCSNNLPIMFFQRVFSYCGMVPDIQLEN